MYNKTNVTLIYELWPKCSRQYLIPSKTMIIKNLKKKTEWSCEDMWKSKHQTWKTRLEMVFVCIYGKEEKSTNAMEINMI